MRVEATQFEKGTQLFTRCVGNRVDQVVGERKESFAQSHPVVEAGLCAQVVRRWFTFFGRYR